MSNLLKVGTTISKSERIIDYNDIIKDRVEAARAASRQKADSDGFINGLNACLLYTSVNMEQLLSDWR